MIIPDLNLLLYAYDSTSPAHEAAVAWWESCLSGSEPVALPDVVLFGFVRLVTHGRVFLNPMTVPQAAGQVRAWLKQPVAQLLAGDPEHVERVLLLLEGVGAAGNLVTDAQLAAFAIENDAVLHTADADVSRFDGVRWFNPLTGARGPAPRRRAR